MMIDSENEPQAGLNAELVPLVLTPEDRADLERAVALLENPGLVARLSDVLGKPIDIVIDRLPAGAASTIDGATRGALRAALALALFATNGFHCWAHMPSPPCLVAWLQQNRVVLGPEAHALHHSGAHNRSYCVTSGWLNPLLDRWRFFARIEAALAGVRIVRRPQADPRVSRRRRAGAGAR